MGNIWRIINVVHGLKHESMLCNPLFTDLYLCLPPYKGLLLQTKYQYKGTRAKLFYCHEMSLKW